ncbi:GroES-like protein, partial [Aspergillus ibericus CBS 121593]
QPSINRALVLHPGGTFSYTERDIPTIQSDRDVLVRVVATGLCGSDACDRLSDIIIHYWQHGKLGRNEVKQPLILGHESSGVIVAIGSKVDVLKFNDRVALEPGISCNICAHCRSGRYNLCTSMQFAATPPVDGTLCTYYRVPAQCCYKLPAHVSFRNGALVEPLSVAVHACRLGGDMQNRNVVVFGAGPVGLLC